MVLYSWWSIIPTFFYDLRQVKLFSSKETSIYRILMIQRRLQRVLKSHRLRRTIAQPCSHLSLVHGNTVEETWMSRLGLPTTRARLCAYKGEIRSSDVHIYSSKCESSSVLWQKDRTQVSSMMAHNYMSQYRLCCELEGYLRGITSWSFMASIVPPFLRPKYKFLLSQK